jgi:uncharacterized protein YndB with AHSA1/START domain
MMDVNNAEPNVTTTERISDRELVVTRMVNAPARIVFDAWTRPDLMMRWWAPKSFGITFISCDIDARTGGSYRFEFGHPSAPQPMALFGKYIDVVPNARIVWTNEESGEGAISTLTFDEKDGVTRLVLHELYPSTAALDEALASGSNGAWPEQYIALDGLVAEMAGQG